MKEKIIGGCGIIYIAFGHDYGIMALYSSKTLKEHNPEVHVTVITNIKWLKDCTDEGVGPFDNAIFYEERQENNRYYKTDMYNLSPYNKTGFIDADTYVTGDISALFRYLDHYDVAIRIIESPPVYDYEVSGEKSVDLFWLHTSVIFFNRNKRAGELFSRWKKYFIENPVSRDMPAMGQAIHSCYVSGIDLSLFQLNTKWSKSRRDDGEWPSVIQSYQRFEKQIWLCRELNSLNKEMARLVFKKNENYDEFSDFDKRTSLLSSRLFRAILHFIPNRNNRLKNLGRNEKGIKRKMNRVEKYKIYNKN